MMTSPTPHRCIECGEWIDPAVQVQDGIVFRHPECVGDTERNE